jgi:hypothetical protein
MSVGIFIAQVLQDTRPTDKRSTAKAIDALNTVDAENRKNAFATPPVSTQQLAGVSDPNDSAHQG